MEVLKRIIDFVMDILETVVFVGSLFIVVYIFFFQPHQIRGASMDNTFKNGDYILTSKISYKFGVPKRGDVVVFKSPKNPDVDYIKRIIGLPGDHIIIQSGKVRLNGEVLNERYIIEPTNAYGGAFQEGVEKIVPEGTILVMGDNRPRSSDGREFGFTPQADVIGKVVLRYLPPQKAGFIHNPYEKE